MRSAHLLVFAPQKNRLDAKLRARYVLSAHMFAQKKSWTPAIQKNRLALRARYVRYAHMICPPIINRCPLLAPHFSKILVPPLPVRCFSHPPIDLEIHFPVIFTMYFEVVTWTQLFHLTVVTCYQCLGQVLPFLWHSWEMPSVYHDFQLQHCRFHMIHIMGCVVYLWSCEAKHGKRSQNCVIGCDRLNKVS